MGNRLQVWGINLQHSFLIKVNGYTSTKQQSNVLSLLSNEGHSGSSRNLIIHSSCGGFALTHKLSILEENNLLPTAGEPLIKK